MIEIIPPELQPVPTPQRGEALGPQCSCLSIKRVWSRDCSTLTDKTHVFMCECKEVEGNTARPKKLTEEYEDDDEKKS